MAGQNDFLSFAIGVGANVLPQPDYSVLPAVSSGFQSGIAVSEQLNKVWRQSSQMAYVIAAFIISQLPTEDVLDNGDPSAIVTQLTAALQQNGITRPARTVTSSAAFTASLSDGIIGFNRTAGLAAQNVTLPNGMAVGQEMKFQDLVGNFGPYPVTLIPPAGQISGRANYVMNEDRQTAIITYYGTNLYGVQS